MTTPLAPSTAVTAPKKPVPAGTSDVVRQLRERNAMVAAIRGTQWGKDCSDTVQRAVAHYCLMNGLDATRHVEMLGGRIYLTAEFYRERGAKLIQSGDVTPLPTRNIHIDPRLDVMIADATDDDMRQWAIAEKRDRLKLRIEYGVPDKAEGAAIVGLKLKNGDVLYGVNWCGGKTNQKVGKGGQLYDADPVGDNQPVKTAEARAERRAWRRVVEVLPNYGDEIRRVEATATIVEDVTEAEHDATEQLREEMRPKALTGATDEEYGMDTGATERQPVPVAALDAGRNNRLARYEALLGKKKRTDAEDMELDDLSQEFKGQ